MIETQPVAVLSRKTSASVAVAIERAFAVRRQAAGLSVHRRSASLREIAAGVRQRREEFARIIASEGIKTIREARLEADRCATTFELSAEECSRLGGETVAFDQVPKGDGRIGWWSRRPLGVVAGLTPYNDPLNLVATNWAQRLLPVHRSSPSRTRERRQLLWNSQDWPLQLIFLPEWCK